jgi:tetratricopeptide (TPR) repeat protein
MEFDNIRVEYRDSSYFKKAIKQFEKGASNSVRYVDNNIIATENSLALYYKQIAQKSQSNGKDFSENKEKAIATIRRVINANKNDGNLYDTYAEILFDLNDRKSSKEFCESVENALNHPNVFDGITLNNYKGDIRWRENDDFKMIIAEFEKKQVLSSKGQFLQKDDSKNKVKSTSHMADTQNEKSNYILSSSKSNSKF